MARRNSNAVLSHLGEGDCKKALAIFQHFDINGNGTIELSEVEAMLTSRDQEEIGNVRRVVAEILTPGKTAMEFQDFVTLLGRVESRKESVREHTLIFKNLLNRSGSGIVAFEEMRSSLAAVGLQPAHQHLHEMIDAVQPRENGFSLQEFLRFKREFDAFDVKLSKKKSAPLDTRCQAWKTFFEDAQRLCHVTSMSYQCMQPVRQIPTNRSLKRMPKEAVTRKVSTDDPKALQLAIDASQPQTTIEVSGSTPLETSLLINVDALRIVAVGRVTIAVDSRHPAIVIRVRTVEFVGFIVTNSGTGPAMEVDQGFPTITNCELIGKNGGLSVRGYLFLFLFFYYGDFVHTRR